MVKAEGCGDVGVEEHEVTDEFLVGSTTCCGRSAVRTGASPSCFSGAGGSVLFHFPCTDGACGAIFSHKRI